VSIRLAAVVFDAADVGAESAFWAELLDGTVRESDGWNSVEVNGGPRIEVQHAPGHVPPDWPDGEPQQVHLDFDVEDIRTAHGRAIMLGARVLQPASGPNFASPVGFQVYADPAGHPFCLCWGQDH
jgi:predicted enzyme related to lactoylglutathione lyase